MFDITDSYLGLFILSVDDVTFYKIDFIINSYFFNSNYFRLV